VGVVVTVLAAAVGLATTLKRERRR
jgi:hypothetical protein